MSREIKDPENPSDDELAYLAQRPFLIAEYESHGLDMEKANAFLEGREPKDITIVTTDAMRVGNQPPAGAARPNLQDEPPAPETQGADDELEPEDDPYEQWTVGDLKAEIDTRNKLRGDDDKLSASGNKDALVARLYEDDAAE